MTRPRHFAANILETTDTRHRRVEMRIDDVPLIDLVHDIESPQAAKEGVPLLAGNYVWPVLTPRLVRLLGGERPGSPAAQGVVLNCGCGWATCWPLTLRVRVFDRYVVWQDLQQAGRASRWSYQPFDPIRFSRTIYLDEIARLREELVRMPAPAHGSRSTAHPRDESDAKTCAL